MSKLTAKVIPFSSVVRGGVTLYDEAGVVVVQLTLLGFTPSGPIPDHILDAVAKGQHPFEAAYMEMCERIAAAINAGQAEGQVHHPGRGATYDVVTSEALFQVSEGVAGIRHVKDGDAVTVYRNPDGKHFVRFPDEMVSPRFEKV